MCYQNDRLVFQYAFYDPLNIKSHSVNENQLSLLQLYLYIRMVKSSYLIESISNTFSITVTQAIDLTRAVQE